MLVYGYPYVCMRYVINLCEYPCMFWNAYMIGYIYICMDICDLYKNILIYVILLSIL